MCLAFFIGYCLAWVELISIMFTDYPVGPFRIFFELKCNGINEENRIIYTKYWWEKASIYLPLIYGFIAMYIMS